MRMFLIILGIVVVLVIVYFIWADYKSRKETEALIESTTTPRVGNQKATTALSWINALLPAITGTIKTILSKNKSEEDSSVSSTVGPPTYEDWLSGQGI